MQPLILTLAIDEQSFQFFNQLRQQYFPPQRNFIDAHLTLFHHLQNETKTIDTVRQAASQQSIFNLSVVDVVSLGAGVAYLLKSDELTHIHRHLQHQFSAQLRPQDKQKLRPHITVQNKVSAGEAQQLLARLRETFKPFEITATGLQLWEYLGGPWKFVQQIDLKKTSE